MQSTRRPNISVVIRTLNEEAHLGALLLAIPRQRGVISEVIVIDSGSSDRTVQIAERAGARLLFIRPNDFSFGRALNRAIEQATGDIVVAASAHVYPLNDDWLLELSAPFDNPAVALTYGRQVGGDESAFSERMIMETWFPVASDLNQHHPFCNNANAAIRRSVWQSIRYNEDLTGLEDLDWARRAMMEGHKIAYIAEAPVAHIHKEPWDRVMNRYRREAIAHRGIYHEQRMSAVETLSLWCRNVTRDVTAAMKDGVLHRELTNILKFRSAQFAGTYRGFAQEGSVPEMLKRRFYYPAARPSSNDATPLSSRSRPSSNGARPLSEATHSTAVSS